MYRKILALFSVLILAPACMYAQKADKFNEALKEAAKMLPSPSPNAHKEGVIYMELLVDGSFVGVEGRVLTSKKECPAVRISPNYLLASAMCMDISGMGIIQHYKGSDYIVEEKARVDRYISGAVIDGVTIPRKDIQYINGENEMKLVLIYIDGNNEKLRRAVETKPIPNLFVAKNPANLPEVFDELTLNREDWYGGDGRTCADVDIAEVCTEDGCFKLCWKMIDGDTGDPVFGRIPKRTTQEFLLGFNATNAKGKRQSGRYYHFFSQKTLDFLRKSLPEKEWKYLQRKVVNESFFQ